MTEVHHETVFFTGRVQGVGFRYQAAQAAKEYEVSGFVVNLPDGRVQLEAEGEPGEVDAFVSAVGERMNRTEHGAACANIQRLHDQMTSAQPLAIRAESLIKYYQTDWKGRRRRALAGVSFAVARGSVCGLIGPNGSGKSTTLMLLAGLLRPDSGRCEIQGQPANEALNLGVIGYLPEALGLPEFLRELARLAGLSEIKIKLTEALALVGLEAEAGRRMGGYSKGMRQRLGLAQAVLGDPVVVLLDEPASGLDPRASGQLGRAIRQLQAQGRTVLLSSHFLPQAKKWCDQLVLMEGGRVVFDGSGAEVLGSGGLQRLYLERTAP
jgi:ABC-2 type transport system ATP-binding protein